MLVLSRKVGETICIGEAIDLTVVSIDKGRVRLAVRAPAEVKVHREEVRENILAGPANSMQGEEGKPGKPDGGWALSPLPTPLEGGSP